jgi:hypothetical protein
MSTLDIGLSDSVPLLAHHDLANYVVPLVPKLTAAAGTPVSDAWRLHRSDPCARRDH